MGCDIHLYVEKQDNRGNWLSVEEWGREYDDQGCDDVKYDDRYYTACNYNVFSALANVRNGPKYGRMQITPIAMPRGLPPDCDQRIKTQSDYCNDDGHSHSYLTLAELLAHTWTDEEYEFATILPCLSKIGAPDEVRIVFWFDN